MWADVAVDEDAARDQHWRGHNEPDRLDETQPLLVRADRGAGDGIDRHQPVAGQR